MSEMSYEALVHAVKALDRADWGRLRAFLDNLINSATVPVPPDEVEREMEREGMITIPPPITDPSPWNNRVPVAIEGKPLSEILIEERDREV